MRLAIAMTIFDRPEYLSRALKSFENLEGLEDHDLYFFAEGPYNNRTAKLCGDARRIAKDFKHPNKTIIYRDRNFGIAHQVYDSKCLLFRNYDMVLSCVDDFDVAPYALTALKTAYLAVESRVDYPFLLDVYSATDLAINSLTPENVSVQSREEKEKDLDLIVEGCHAAFYLMSKSVWEKIEPYYKEYIDMFVQPHIEKSRPYGFRTNAAIRVWFAQLLGEALSPVYPSSQDACVEVVCKKLGIKKLSTRVNHIACFGERGEHQTPSSFAGSNYDLTKLDLFNASEVLEALSHPRIEV